MAKKEKSKSGSGFFWGFVLGLAVGAALAVMFAPQPGDQTREQLSEQGVLLRSRGRERAEQLRGELKGRYGDAMFQGREAYGRAKDEVLTRYNRAKNGE
ncbi:MAG TPA: YtxH domain-containing protein [Ktedonobacterales bacterium]|nr:YtxH domain-containing protein [Ktedonobacterales bacterium]